MKDFRFPETVRIQSDIRVSSDGRGLAMVDVVYAVRDSRLYSLRILAIGYKEFSIPIDSIAFYENAQLYLTKEGMEYLKLVAYKMNWFSIYARLDQLLNILTQKEN